MIIVKEEKLVPYADIRCGNCDSLLQYGNADLHEEYNQSNITAVSQEYLKQYYFICPVCGCKVRASWIIKKGE